MSNSRQPHPNNYNHNHLSNGAYNAPGMGPGAASGPNYLPNNGRIIQSGGTRILCVADVRGMASCVQRKVNLLIPPYIS